jgi:hypothetical protein
MYYVLRTMEYLCRLCNETDEGYTYTYWTLFYFLQTYAYCSEVEKNLK